jgi:hypothetical protein
MEGMNKEDRSDPERTPFIQKWEEGCVARNHINQKKAG